MISKRTIAHRTVIENARRDPDAAIWQRVWNEIAARYRRGEISDAEHDRLLESMP